MLTPNDCRPGVRVECVRGDPHGGLFKCYYIVFPLKVGSIYTIDHYDESICEICLQEVHGTLGQIFWSLTRFRLPRDLREVFREALQPLPSIKEKEHA